MKGLSQGLTRLFDKLTFACYHKTELEHEFRSSRPPTRGGYDKGLTALPHDVLVLLITQYCGQCSKRSLRATSRVLRELVDNSSQQLSVALARRSRLTAQVQWPLMVHLLPRLHSLRSLSLSVGGLDQPTACLALITQLRLALARGQCTHLRSVKLSLLDTQLTPQLLVVAASLPGLHSLHLEARGYTTSCLAAAQASQHAAHPSFSSAAHMAASTQQRARQDSSHGLGLPLGHKTHPGLPPASGAWQKLGYPPSVRGLQALSITAVDEQGLQAGAFMWDSELACFTAWHGLRSLHLSGVAAAWPEQQEVNGGLLLRQAWGTSGLQALAVMGVSLPSPVTLLPDEHLTAAQQLRRCTKQHPLLPCPATCHPADPGGGGRGAASRPAADPPPGQQQQTAPEPGHALESSSLPAAAQGGGWSRTATSCLQRLSLSTSPLGQVRLPHGLLLSPCPTQPPVWSALTQLSLGGLGLCQQGGVEGSEGGGVLLAGELERLGRLAALRHLALSCALESAGLRELEPGCLQGLTRLTLTASMATGDLASLLRSRALHPDCHLELGCWLGLSHAANTCGLARDAAALAAHPGGFSCLMLGQASWPGGGGEGAQQCPGGKEVQGLRGLKLNMDACPADREELGAALSPLLPQLQALLLFTSDDATLVARTLTAPWLLDATPQLQLLGAWQSGTASLPLARALLRAARKHLLPRISRANSCRQQPGGVAGGAGGRPSPLQQWVWRSPSRRLSGRPSPTRLASTTLGHTPVRPGHTCTPAESSGGEPVNNNNNNSQVAARLGSGGQHGCERVSSSSSKAVGQRLGECQGQGGNEEGSGGSEGSSSDSDSSSSSKGRKSCPGTRVRVEGGSSGGPSLASSCASSSKGSCLSLTDSSLSPSSTGSLTPRKSSTGVKEEGGAWCNWGLGAADPPCGSAAGGPEGGSQPAGQRVGGGPCCAPGGDAGNHHPGTGPATGGGEGGPGAAAASPGLRSPRAPPARPHTSPFQRPAAGPLGGSSRSSRSGSGPGARQCSRLRQLVLCGQSAAQDVFTQDRPASCLCEVLALAPPAFNLLLAVTPDSHSLAAQSAALEQLQQALTAQGLDADMVSLVAAAL